jgi:hypothetical protein
VADHTIVAKLRLDLNPILVCVLSILAPLIRHGPLYYSSPTPT